MPASAAGPSAATSCTTKPPPRRPQLHADAGPAGAADAVVGRLGRRRIARIGVEVVEQLVEEAAQHALRAGPPHRLGGVPAAAHELRGRLAPARGIVRRRAARGLTSVRGAGAQPQRAVAQFHRQPRVERGQPAQPPQRELPDRHGLQRARRHEGERGGGDLRHQPLVQRLAGHERLGARPAARGTAASRNAGDHHRRRDASPPVAPGRAAGRGRPCRMWNTSPPVTGLASASRTSTSWARRIGEARAPARQGLGRFVVNPEIVWQGRHRDESARAAAGNCDEKTEPGHAGNARREHALRPCRP